MWGIFLIIDVGAQSTIGGATHRQVVLSYIRNQTEQGMGKKSVRSIVEYYLKMCYICLCCGTFV